MVPLSGLRLDVEAVSGILGSISIACWVVVFTPQILENFRRSSAEGLSLLFLIVWLLGDVFNILGAVLQGVLPTMIVLAVYYTLADIVLLCQCFYYRGFTLSDAPGPTHAAEGDDAEDRPLLHRADSAEQRSYNTTGAGADRRPAHGERSLSASSAVDVAHLSPATPLLADQDGEAPAARNLKPGSTLQSFLFNTVALVLVCVAGACGWWLSTSRQRGRAEHGGYEPADLVLPAQMSGRGPLSAASRHEELELDVLGQCFGYLCAVFYLGSRLPQLLLNYRRKSTEGVSFLFFLFACVGNLTYVLSIFAYDPICHRPRPGGSHDGVVGMHRDVGLTAAGGYGRHRRWGQCEGEEWWDKYAWYILVNLSWLIGSAGTLALDFAIFVQFWLYKGRKPRTAGERE